MWYFGTSTGESDKMATFGWVLIAGAFLILIMVANNSWPWVWAKISAGIPQPGQGNPIVPTPPEASAPFAFGSDTGNIPLNSNSNGNITTPATQLVPTVNGVVQSSTGNQASA